MSAGPTGTVALPKPPQMSAGPTGTVALPKPPQMSTGPTGTVALPKPPQMSSDAAATRRPGGTMAFEYASTRREAGSMGFDYSASTVLLQDVAASRPVPTSAAPPTLSPAAQGSPAVPPSLTRGARSYRSGLAAALVAMLVLGALILTHRAEQVPAALPAREAQAPEAMQATTSSGPDLRPPPAAPRSEADAPPAQSADVTAPTPVPAAVAASLAQSTAPARPDLSGTWRGEYLDASGKQLLRVVSLNISRVQDDGGIEGTILYEAPSGAGECQLHPRSSTFSAGEQRLQLSPESCSPHYPRELGVPLDFDRVNPRAIALRNGRVEAPTGEVIRVRLERVQGS
jgi:hypothetical protein